MEAPSWVFGAGCVLVPGWLALGASTFLGGCCSARLRSLMICAHCSSFPSWSMIKAAPFLGGERSTQPCYLVVVTWRGHVLVWLALGEASFLGGWCLACPCSWTHGAALLVCAPRGQLLGDRHLVQPNFLVPPVSCNVCPAFCVMNCASCIMCTASYIHAQTDKLFIPNAL